MSVTEEEREILRLAYLELYEKAGIYLTEDEKRQVFHWDFYTDSADIGLSCVTYLKSARCCARELALLPNRFTPEHRHPPVGAKPGREKTLRCRYGTAYVHVEGERARDLHSCVPPHRMEHFTALAEIVLERGQQYTLPPDTLSWLQAGGEGCVITEFSPEAMDQYDIYTDPQIMKEHARELQKYQAPIMKVQFSKAKL